MKKVQILYPKEKSGKIVPYFYEESIRMVEYGFIVNPIKKVYSDCTLLRGFIMRHPDEYCADSRLIQDWDSYEKTLNISEYYPIIDKWSIPSVIVNKLDESFIRELSHKMGWSKLFIKSNARSIHSIDSDASVWPNKSISQIKEAYENINSGQIFAIRKYINNPQIFYDEQRYWVLNGIAYHPSGVIPDFVQEAATRLYEFSGSHYFTIDVAGDYIVEVNPGESSDRGGDNPLEWFCEIFANTFLK